MVYYDVSNYLFLRKSQCWESLGSIFFCASRLWWFILENLVWKVLGNCSKLNKVSKALVRLGVLIGPGPDWPGPKIEFGRRHGLRTGPV